MITTPVERLYLNNMNELGAFFDAITEPILVYDRKSIVIQTNKAAVDSLGFDPKGWSSIDITEKVSSTLDDGRKTGIDDIISKRALRGEVVREIIYTFTNAKGETRTCSCSASPVKTGDVIAGVICIWHDITRDREKEVSYINERKWFMNILDSIEDGIYICNENFTVEYANPALVNRLGSPGGKKCYEYLYGRKKQCPWCKNPDVLNGKTIRWEWYDPDSGKTYDLIETPIYNADGSISKLKIFHDITYSKEREKALKKDRKELLNDLDRISVELIKKTSDLEIKNNKLHQQSEIIDKLFANTQFLIALLDTDFNFIRVNKAYAESDGRDESFFIGKNHFDLYPHSENEAIFRSVLQSGESYITYAKPFSYPQKPEEGFTYWDWSLNPIMDENNEVTALILILLDVTARKKTEAELGESKRLSDIGALATTVAHELRSPLGVIQGTVYNIKRKYSDEKLMKHMERIERKIDESEKIINNLLNYSRIKQPQWKNIHFYNFLDECINDIESQYMNPDIKVNRDFDTFKDITVEIDPFQMREVFLNILNNAFQAFPDNSGIIDIKGYTEKSILYIDIRDNGQGIAKEVLDKIFEPFFTSKSRGTGLGLTICRELLNLHRGSIEIESEKDRGTVVHLSLPGERDLK
ncbi:MAG: PAS domain-containing protein [Spirochaetales bacterium]|nr:PAS domain-containing protein [Spirochaetales bacterium]